MLHELESFATLRLLNELYGLHVPPGVEATPPDADVLIRRVRQMTPQKYGLFLKAVKGSDMPSRRFSLATKATGDISATPTISGVASSASLDLDSAVFGEQALRDMLALKGLNGYLNHRYLIPDDLLGRIIATSISKTAGVSKLLIDIAVETSNPRAVQSWQAVKNGTRLGLSVGVIVLESHPIELPGSKTKAESLDRVLPLECSLVALPSNFTDAWTTAAKSQRGRS